MDITAVITTRGDVDLAPVLDSLPPKWPVVVWDNSQRDHDMKVYGYFAALPEVKTEYVYTQADDAICPAAELLAAWDERDRAETLRAEEELGIPLAPGSLRHSDILLNVADGDTPWISFGAIFHRDLPGPALQRYRDAYHGGELHDDVLKWCEVIVLELTPWVNVDLGKVDLPAHTNPNRMEHQQDHYSEQARVRELARALR